MRKAESRLDRAFQGMFRKRSHVNVRPVELAWKLVKEMEDNKLSSSSRVFVPHEYTVYLCPSDYNRFQPYEESLVRQLQNHLLHHARKNAFNMVGAPAVKVEMDADLRSGEFGIGTGNVALSGVASPLGMDTPRAGSGESSAAFVEAGQAEQDPAVRPAVSSSAAAAPPQEASISAADPAGRPASTPGVVVLKRGRYSEEFRSARVVLGRGSEADYRLDDPNVSRRHAVIVRESGGLHLRDLGSTNGTFLNGRTVNSAILRSGDVITLGESQITVETD
ncbi:MAG: DUF3662 domain-containing protein [Gaiellales bacterium]|nr:DUF3662 domain-containing protein [Gaiellales bacterium]